MTVDLMPSVQALGSVTFRDENNYTKDLRSTKNVRMLFSSATEQANED
jgi:hypothetical protein